MRSPQPANRHHFECRVSKVILIIGTRPDTIKLIPVYQALKKLNISAFLCSTGQHEELTKNLFHLFDIQPDFDFKIMKSDQDLFDSTLLVLEKSKQLFQKMRPSLVVVQGDTTSAMSAALAAFYLKIPIAHVEAGLRTPNINRPFPEEMNRRLITLLASIHFAPTPFAANHLKNERVPQKSIYCTGNTIVDSLYHIQSEMAKNRIAPSFKILEMVHSLKNSGKTILLLTAHRRESFDEGLTQIFAAIHQAIIQNPRLHVIYPLHPNPAIVKILKKSKLFASPRAHIVAPLPYQDLIYVLTAADVVATDSGGIQEEGVSLNKQVLVLREETDRPEGIIDGLAHLVGTDSKKIVSAIRKITKPGKRPKSCSSPYGDGKASERIARVIQKFIQKHSS